MKSKQYTVTWNEEVRYSATVYANDEEDARAKFINGEVFNQEIDETTFIEGSEEISNYE